jgi:hypothetical protein
LARFSAQSVSSTPISGLSTASTNPRSVQKLRSTGYTCSGGWVLTSQRVWPSRARRTSPTALGATVGPPLAACAPPAAPGWRIAEALTTPDWVW